MRLAVRLMNLNGTIVVVGGCMRLERTKLLKNETRRTRRDRRRDATKANATARRGFTRKQITELLFENCIGCGKMAAIPHGAFAAYKVYENQVVSMSTMEGEKEKTNKENAFNSRLPLKGCELTPLKYNSKLMNSIWGLYNRYSVHNFKKNTDAEEGARGTVTAAIWGVILDNRPPAANAAAAAVTAENPRIMTGNGL